LWDDLPAIVTNETIRNLFSFPGALAPPLETPMAGRPVVNLSLAINFALGGLQVEGYHWWNIGVHLMCAVLLFAILRRSLSDGRLGAVFGSGAPIVAFVAAAVWMVHPLQTEAVDYVTQRTESMMALFLLLTLYCSMRSMRARRPWRWQTLAVVSCVLGMASKASMVAAPLIVLLYDRTFESDSILRTLRRRRWLYLGLAASWLVLAALTWAAPRSTVGSSASVTWQLYLLNQAQMVGRYLRLALWPRGLVLDYGLPQALSVRDVWPQALVILALASGVVIALVRRWVVGFVGAAFFLMLAPTSSVIPIISEVGAERRMYVPMMALVSLAVPVGWLLLQRLARSAPTRSRLLNVGGGGVAAGVVVALALPTIARNERYRDAAALWRDTIEQRPNARARLSLATALMAGGKGAEAIPELRLAVQDYPEAKYALGAALHAAGQVDEAVALLGEFIAAEPSSPSRIPAQSLLGQILASRGDHDGAAAHFRAILQVNPLDRNARVRLADQLLSGEQWDEAVAEYDRLTREADSASLELKLGLAHKGANRFDAARDHFERALALDPGTLQAHSSLGEIAWERGNVGDAVSHAEAELRLNPLDASTHNFLGVVLASSGRVGEGAVHFREALRIDPTNVRARENLARAERDSRR
jgi:tetratricopeptide (TPR) repeat protein